MVCFWIGNLSLTVFGKIDQEVSGEVVQGKSSRRIIPTLLLEVAHKDKQLTSRSNLAVNLFAELTGVVLLVVMRSTGLFDGSRR